MEISSLIVSELFIIKPSQLSLFFSLLNTNSRLNKKEIFYWCFNFYSILIIKN